MKKNFVKKSFAVLTAAALFLTACGTGKQSGSVPEDSHRGDETEGLGNAGGSL